MLVYQRVNIPYMYPMGYGETLQKHQVFGVLELQAQDSTTLSPPAEYS